MKSRVVPRTLSLSILWCCPPKAIIPKAKRIKIFITDTTVTSRQEGDATVTEYRLKGQLYKMVVKPVKGAAYTLVDEKGDGKFVRSGEQLAKVAVPMWILLRW
ncbi:MAG: DUF2782 domain-containing protein [Gammaproteobacteria bacterium]|nr:DUF2782 domain-containing protein [Gammaproteobacteria bacterium]